MYKAYKIYIAFIITAFFSVVVFAQNDTANFIFEKKIVGKFSYLNVDNLENIYTITSTNQLKKINSKGDSLAVFNDIKRYGNAKYVDVNNPLKVLLYYPKFATVVVLDRFFNNRSTINLRKQNIFLANAITTSYDNAIWLFDEQNFTLKKISDQGKTLFESIDWRTLLDTVPTPNLIIDRNNFVYMYDSTKGFFVFDYYGAYKTRLNFKNWKNIAISGNYLYGFLQNTLQSYNLQTAVLNEYKLPKQFLNCLYIKAMNDKVYLLKNDGIEIYKIK